MKSLLILITSFLIVLGCSNSRCKELNKPKNTTHLLDNTNQYNDALVIYCDSIYKSAGYKLTLISDQSSIEDDALINSIFRFAKVVNGKEIEVFSDSIFSSSKVVKFEDFNNDKIKDILIQNVSDVRSNWTYYLYLVDMKVNKLTKVKGFEEIKNPRFNHKFNVIENYVNSGENWTEFYGIKDDSVFNYGITIHDEMDENGESNYESEYQKALGILKSKI
jgi:hypothetical protein